jgi:hypothetical protein
VISANSAISAFQSHFLARLIGARFSFCSRQSLQNRYSLTGEPPINGDAIRFAFRRHFFRGLSQHRAMWCSSCQQDVPAIASPEDRTVRCAKCREELRRDGLRGVDQPEIAAARPGSRSGGKSPSPPPTAESDIEVPTHAFFERPPFDLDTWEWDEDLREAERLIRTWGASGGDVRTRDASKSPSPKDGPVASDWLRGVSAASSSGIPNSPRWPASPPAPRPAPSGQRTPSRGHPILTWLMLSLGVMALVFGSVLLGWSTWTNRPDLWTLGLPFALGGQAALVIGLVLQLDNLWQSNHAATETMTELDGQLMELRRATSQLSNTHSAASQSFYFHLAEGCSPHLLLADLKGQLDLLALRIADHK